MGLALADLEALLKVFEKLLGKRYDMTQSLSWRCQKRRPIYACKETDYAFDCFFEGYSLTQKKSHVPFCD